jgi:ech hydrogenase subunit C
MGPVDLARAWVRRSRTKSPWLVHFDCGGCNGCDIEVLDTLTPRWSTERFGVINVGDPRQADVLVITGPANRRNAWTLRSVYEQMSEPKTVVAVGSCAAHGGIFRGSPNVLGGVGAVVPVDVFVPGCPPPPERILAGIIEAAPSLAEVRPARAPTSGPGGPSLVTQPPGGRPSLEDDVSTEPVPTPTEPVDPARRAAP